MKLTTTIPLTLLSAISLLPSTSAWKFTWRDDEGNDSTESGKGPHSCVKIQHAQGETYAWDNQGNENIGINLYTSSDCSGSMAGWSIDVWEKKSSKDLLSFKVAREGATTTAAATTGSHTGSDASSTATVSTGGASNATETGSSSAVRTKTKTATHASATGSSSAASSKTASGSTAESTDSSSTATGASGSGTPSPTASATDGASTDESSASSLSKSRAVMAVAGLALGMATFEWLV